MTDVAIGNGNLKNIEILKELFDKQIIILENPHRDYTHGKADEMLKTLFDRQNVLCLNKHELLDRIKKDQI